MGSMETKKCLVGGRRSLRHYDSLSLSPSNVRIVGSFAVSTAARTRDDGARVRRPPHDQAALWADQEAGGACSRGRSCSGIVSTPRWDLMFLILSGTARPTCIPPRVASVCAANGRSVQHTRSVPPLCQQSKYRLSCVYQPLRGSMRVPFLQRQRSSSSGQW